MTENINIAQAVIAHFADACERMNDLGRSINQELNLPVTPSADIRVYETGWQLEKFIEAELSDGCWAVWSIDFSCSAMRWKVSSSVSISHDGYYQGFDDEYSLDESTLKKSLSHVIERLASAHSFGTAFRRRIDELSPK